MDNKVIKKIRSEIRRTANIFSGIGLAILVFASLRFPQEYSLGRFIISIGVSIMTVGLIARIWDLLGGDPLTNVLKWMAKKHHLEKIGFDDLIIRKTTGKETTEFFSMVYEKIETAKSEVDIMGLVLWRNFFHSDKFIKTFEGSLAKNKSKFRILILKPFDDIKKSSTDNNLTMNDFTGSAILSQRAVDEALTDSDKNQVKKPMQEAYRMHGDINMTLNRLKSEVKSVVKSKVESEVKKMDAKMDAEEKEKEIKEIKKKIEEEIKEEIKVKVTDKAYINCSIVRIDNDDIIAIHYLHKTGGAGTPILQVKGPNTELFEIYRKEFNIVWNNSQEVNLWPKSI